MSHMGFAVLALVASLVLVLANAFFVASEFAIVKIRPTRLEQLARRGDARARAALDITRRLDAYLSANQLGITLASLALGWLGEPAFARLLMPLFARLGHGAVWASHGVAVVMAFVIITFLHTVLGELAPKSLAIQRTEPVALWTARPLHVFYVLAYPIIWTLNAAAAFSLRLLRLRPLSEAERLHSPEELRLVLRHVAMEPGALRLIDRVFDYSRRVARHVMTLRRDVVVLETGRTFEENLARVLHNQYTRYPLIDSDTDEVIGYVHLKDLMAALAEGSRPPVRDIARHPVFATESTPLEDIRRALQRQRTHLAIIVNARGAFTGIVTLEDLLEEFVGEILDEQDVGEVPPIVRAPDGSFECDGRVTLDVAERELDLRLEDAPDGVETLGGYVMARLAAVPKPGDEVRANGFMLTVLEVRDRRARRLRGRPVSAEETIATPRSMH